MIIEYFKDLGFNINYDAFNILIQDVVVELIEDQIRNGIDIYDIRDQFVNFGLDNDKLEKYIDKMTRKKFKK